MAGDRRQATGGGVGSGRASSSEVHERNQLYPRLNLNLNRLLADDRQAPLSGGSSRCLCLYTVTDREKERERERERKRELLALEVWEGLLDNSFRGQVRWVHTCSR